jgi:hypothetical protein
MDILAHFLWTFGIFFKQKKAWLFGLIGILPDIISFGPHFVYSLATVGIRRGRPEAHSFPDYINTMYNITHSFVIFLIVLALAYFLFKNYAIFLLPWGIHILIDIPTHSKAFFPTPFLWPISYFMIDGISWGTPWFMITNYTLIVLFFVFRFVKK